MPSVKRFASMLDEAGIDYRLIETGDRYAAIMVKDECYSAYSDMLRRKNIGRYEHPYGKMYGYRFLYGMRPFELVGIDDIYCEIFFQIPCMSLTPRSWIPLDRIIQSLAWESFSDRDGVKTVNPVCLYIYRLCWAVFMDGGFSENTLSVLEENSSVLDEKIFHDCIRMVFFRFSDELAGLLREKSFDEIIPRYWKFIQY